MFIMPINNSRIQLYEGCMQLKPVYNINTYMCAGTVKPPLAFVERFVHACDLSDCLDERTL